MTTRQREAGVQKVRLGTWITAPHPSIVELMAYFPFEWLCVDMEHSPVSLSELQVALAIIQSKKKKAFVRIRQNTHVDAKFPLDAGADGIIIPMVNSAQEAEAAVANCLYPPTGRRGVGLARAHMFGFAFEEHLEANHKQLEIILQVEHIQAVRELDSILSIKGLTGIFVGPYDLSGSMGIPGQLDAPQLIEALDLVAEKTLKAGKLLGIHVVPPERDRILTAAGQGYNFIAFSTDTYILGQKISDELKFLNEKIPL